VRNALRVKASIFIVIPVEQGNVEKGSVVQIQLF
jgi:molybdopterin biosynthesis enzyme